MTGTAAAYRAVCYALKFAIAAVLVFAFAWGVAMLTGCGRAKPVRVPHVPYKAHFDAKDCRYLPDGVMFTCKHVVFDPTVIDASELKAAQ